MGTRQRRGRERVGVRSRILDAARQLFAAEGDDAVSMRRIADVIDSSPTAIHFHFEERDAPVRELYTADFGHLAVACGALAGVADPVERLRRLARV